MSSGTGDAVTRTEVEPGRRVRRARVATDPRFSRRRRAVERSHRRRLAARATGAAGAALLVWLTFFSPLLDVRTVKVAGARHTSSEEIQASAAIAHGQNVLLLSTGEIARSIEALPWIKRAEVDRMLPSTVRVRVTERKPALVLSLGAARWTIDSSGRVLTAGVVKKGLPVLAGVQVATIEPGGRVQTAEAVAALEVWRGLPRKLRTRVVAVVAPTLERISLKLANGTLVRYGAAEDMVAKNEVIRVVLTRLRSAGRPADYIDVRVPTAPAISYRAGP